MTNSYCKTKAGKVFKIWSDNTVEKTLDVYPVDETFDPELTVTTQIEYSDVERIESRLSALTTP